jgi:hypothetical protein
MLGMMLLDLDNLVKRYNVLTPAETSEIAHGIVPAILPRSVFPKSLICKGQVDPKLKDSSVLKTSRGGLNKGHVFGTVVNNGKWLQMLCGVRHADLSLEQNL